MANIITQQKIVDNTKRALLKYTIISDGTNEANTRLVDASALAYSLNTNGYIMTGDTDAKSNYRTTIKRISGSLSTSGAHIRVRWEGASNADIVTMSSGSTDYNFGGSYDSATVSNPETSPTGDILITTKGFDANTVATIIIDLKKDNRDYDAGQTADPVAFNRGPAAP